MTITELNSIYKSNVLFLLDAYNNIIEEYNGYYKNTNHADFLEEYYNRLDDLDTYNIKDNKLLHEIKKKYSKYHTFVIISGEHIATGSSFKFPGMFFKIPNISIFVTDYLGIVAKYNVKHELKVISKQIYTPYAIELICKRGK